MEKLDINIKSNEKNYPIFIDNNDIENLKSDILNFIGNNNYIAVFSQKVYKIYGQILDFPKEKTLVIKDGENEKSLKTYIKITDFALKNKLTRQASIIAIGGGVIGDVVGFAASTYMRGINYIQVPTTLLACTDSSVGGKTAVNSKYGKNLIGSFYQPKAVFINANFLKTLDSRQFKSGLGEIVKYGFIENSCPANEKSNIINFLTEHYEKILQKDILTLMELIKNCIRLKISVVQQDEKENGLRRILNFGHTFAHALEKISNYKYTHGECVVQGINVAFSLALKRNLIDKEYKFLCEDLIKKYDFKPIPKYNTNRIIDIMKTDKKADNNNIKFILPTQYAQVGEYDYSPEELAELI